MTEPLLSVIIPYYKGERFILETLMSIFNEKYSNLEVIVVSDGSPEESLKVLEPYLDKIVLIKQENQGQAAARNTGFKHSRGVLVSFIDQDDLWPAGRLKLMLDEFDNDPDADYVRGLTEQFSIIDGQKVIIKTAFQEALIGSAIYRRTVLDKVGLFDKDMREGEDFDWNIRLREKGGKEKRISAVTFCHRRHESNQSSETDHIKNGQLASLRRKLERARNNIKD